MEAQVEAAYELEQSGIETSKIWFIFCRAEASEAEDQAARDICAKARINVFAPVFPELPSIRQGHKPRPGRFRNPIPKGSGTRDSTSASRRRSAASQA